ncbi:hypothetical protein BHM03_00020608 [Ensete ventricosum]|nr:hypothetical protein BHM03_00020608 [Ensete ventricosum]
MIGCTLAAPSYSPLPHLLNRPALLRHERAAKKIKDLLPSSFREAEQELRDLRLRFEEYHCSDPSSRARSNIVAAAFHYNRTLLPPTASHSLPNRVSASPIQVAINPRGRHSFPALPLLPRSSPSPLLPLGRVYTPSTPSTSSRCNFPYRSLGVCCNFHSHAILLLHLRHHCRCLLCLSFSLPLPALPSPALCHSRTTLLSLSFPRCSGTGYTATAFHSNRPCFYLYVIVFLNREDSPTTIAPSTTSNVTTIPRDPFRSSRSKHRWPQNQDRSPRRSLSLPSLSVPHGFPPLRLIAATTPIAAFQQIAATISSLETMLLPFFFPTLVAACVLLVTHPLGFLPLLPLQRP